jgi:putative membrane protein
MLLELYPWIKAFHIISVIAWMAGIFYLPRLFVYHTEIAENGSLLDVTFQTMERRLLKAIMTPAMLAAWVFGLLMIPIPGVFDWSSVWPWIKILSVIGMTIFHFWLVARRKDFISGTNTVSGRSYRLMNEVPTVLMIIIVIMVVVRPF